MADFYRELINYSSQIEKEIEKAQSFLKNGPDGYLSCASDNGRLRYFQKSYGSHAHKSIKCLSKKKPNLIRDLAQKRYYQDLLPVLLREIKILKSLDEELKKKHKEKCFSKSNQFRKPWISPAFALEEDYIKKWEEQVITYKEIDPSVRTLRTRNGELVRSKSEKIIADELFYHGIPYRYEAALTLGSVTIYPDFTILNPRNGRIFYLEHLGMLDNLDYYKNVLHRLDLYAQNDIVIGNQLFLTYETNHYPLNTRTLQLIIKDNFT